MLISPREKIVPALAFAAALTVLVGTATLLGLV